jgi:glucose dehydrogenase
MGPTGASRQSTANSGAFDWPMYRRDLAGTAYSPLTQIGVKNVASRYERLMMRTTGSYGRAAG